MKEVYTCRIHLQSQQRRARDHMQKATPIHLSMPSTNDLSKLFPILPTPSPYNQSTPDTRVREPPQRGKDPFLPYWRSKSSDIMDRPQLSSTNTSGKRRPVVASPGTKVDAPMIESWPQFAFTRSHPSSAYHAVDIAQRLLVRDD